MHTSRRLIACSAGVALGLLSAGAVAQHCTEPTDLIIADLAGDEIQPKSAAADGDVDGRDFLVWQRNIGHGYDIALQLIDAHGNETFPHNGLVIADRSFSSTQDYGLDVDRSGFALLAFRDDRFGGTKITAQRVGKDGSLPWGANGAQFSDGNAFVASPKIAGTSDGQCVVAWTQEKNVHLQRLDADGNLLWSAETVLTDPNGASLSLADLHPSVNGDVIVSWVQSTSFNAPKHLYAQRISTTGAVQWSGGHVRVFDGGSLQFGNFPPFVEDGSGGGVFAWYNTSGALQCYVQHVDADGTELFAHNGVPVSINSLQDRVSPSAAYDPATDSIYVFWMEQSNAQANRGVYGQRIDGSGSRLWGDSGIVVRPVSSGTDYRSINTIFADGKATVCFIESAGFDNDTVRAAGVTDAGILRWMPGIVSLTPGGTGRSRLTANAISITNSALLVWEHGGTGQSDIHAQRLRTNTGTIGTVPIDLTVAGACPGTLAIRAFDCTPVGRVAFVYARSAGGFTIPNNMPCAGTRLCLGSPVTLARTVTADGAGIALLSANAPNVACGGRILIQAIDLSTCATSRAVPTP